MCIPTVNARKKKKKDLSGKITDNVFVDKKFNYQLIIPETWKAKIKKNEDDLRVSLIQKKPKIPDDFDSPIYAVTPVINIYIAEISYSPEKYIDSLISDTYNSELKKKIMAEIKIYDHELQFQWLRNIQKKSARINKLPAVLWNGKANHETKFVYWTQPRDYGVTIICVKKDNLILIFAMRCEEQFARELSDELLKIAETLKW